MKQKLLLMLLALGMCSISMNAQTRTRQVEDDGFVWYKIMQNGKEGAQSTDGSTIVPCNYDKVWYNEIADGWFLVRQNGNPPYFGAYEKDGRCTISINRGYTSIHKLDETDGYYYEVEKNGKIGACNVNGREIIAPQYESYSLIYFDNDHVFKYKNSSGKYISTGISLKSSASPSSSSTSSSTYDYVFEFDNYYENNTLVNKNATISISRNGNIIVVYGDERYQYQYTMAYYTEPSEEEKSLYVLGTLGFGSEYDLPSHVIFANNGNERIKISDDGVIEWKIKGGREYKTKANNTVKEKFYEIKREVENKTFMSQ